MSVKNSDTTIAAEASASPAPAADNASADVRTESAAAQSVSHPAGDSPAQRAVVPSALPDPEEFFRQWPESALEAAGVSGPKFLLESFDCLASKESPAREKAKALRQAMAFVVGAKHRRNLRALEDYLGHLHYETPEPDPTPGNPLRPAPGPAVMSAAKAVAANAATSKNIGNAAAPAAHGAGPRIDAPAADVPIRKIALDDIVELEELQVRAQMDDATIEDYAEAMGRGEHLPPVVVFDDGTRLVLASGFHRLQAARRAELKEIDAEIRSGDVKAALWCALGANSRHGRRLSPGDKAKAVLIALREFADKSQAIVAEHVGCTQPYVSKIKTQGISGYDLPLADRVVGKDGKSYPATRPAPRAEAPADAPPPGAGNSTDNTDDTGESQIETMVPSATTKETVATDAPVEPEAADGGASPDHDDAPPPELVRQWREALLGMSRDLPRSWLGPLANTMREAADNLTEMLLNPMGL